MLYNLLHTVGLGRYILVAFIVKYSLLIVIDDQLAPQ